MKKTLSFILTLLTFVTSAFVTNSFAQDASPEYVVRVIYFVPNDRQPKPDIDKMLDTQIKEAQRFFADQLEAHGFDRKTFRIETDGAGNAIVHHVNGQHDDAYYRNPSIGGSHSAVNEIAEQFDMSKNIYYIVLDSSSIFIDGSEIYDESGVVISGTTGWASGNGVSGVAFVTAFEKVPTIHELGHAFGLSHDYRPNSEAKRIYTQLDFREPMTTSFCAAEWLDANRYFNLIQKEDNNNTDIQLHAPELIELPTKIRLRITLTDPDGLHQVQLLNPQWFLPDPLAHLAGRDEHTLGACQRLHGNRATVEFVTPDLVELDSATDELIIVNKISLQIIDGDGNFASRLFDIDITPLLPLRDVISIPDENLAAIIREGLGLVSGNPITYLDMLRLSKLVAVDRQITNLMKFEHALYLRELNLLANQIEDITPLSQLSRLDKLSIGFNQIRDITPLTALTNLRYLSLGDNAISDITVLTSLPSLEVLGIGDNPISDISPIWELTQLRYLSLRFLEIRDVFPLTEFTGLRELQLDFAQISDIRPLSGLMDLTSLSLRNNQISDISPLAGFTNLEELYLAGNPIEDFSPLRILLTNNPNLKIDIDIPEPLPLAFSPSTIADQTFEVGRTIEALTLPEATGGTAPYTYALSPIPDGLAFDTTTRELNGTPTTLGTTEVTYTAIDATDASASLTFTITVEVNLDVNGDGIVNILDLVTVASGFGTDSPDINGDGIVNILDLVAVANAFSQ